ncbi:hypothetical protein PAECIP112173_01615 [Paenibacillus sp. JJ-100]|uniref:hypothetical protein n=1 Tax=Paenibacillus sp. JJ-100 TaxID=2974896 RepID=UPI0022FF75E1|nr:hypothetical protein [Paenibacillus sp. JJ-100]CAI6056619.1 hypothetical protein PAECIP112173_01615 [Paenibacillus sp. JJ-100]
MVRKFFGLIFLIYAIGMPIAFFNAGNHKQIKSDPITFIGLVILEFVFIFFANKLLRKKKVSQQKYYGGYSRIDLGEELGHADDYSNDFSNNYSNDYPSTSNYSNYSSNTVVYTNNNSVSYTEININNNTYHEEEPDKKAEAKVEEPPRKVTMTCPGCGAKVNLYRNQFTDCDYCGTTVES